MRTRQAVKGLKNIIIIKLQLSSDDYMYSLFSEKAYTVDIFVVTDIFSKIVVCSVHIFIH